MHWYFGNCSNWKAGYVECSSDNFKSFIVNNPLGSLCLTLWLVYHHANKKKRSLWQDIRVRPLWQGFCNETESHHRFAISYRLLKRKDQGTPRLKNEPHWVTSIDFQRSRQEAIAWLSEHDERQPNTRKGVWPPILPPSSTQHAPHCFQRHREM